MGVVVGDVANRRAAKARAWLVGIMLAQGCVAYRYGSAAESETEQGTRPRGSDLQTGASEAGTDDSGAGTLDGWVSGDAGPVSVADLCADGAKGSCLGDTWVTCGATGEATARVDCREGLGPDTDTCMVGRCVSGTGCVRTAADEGAVCDDGVFCNGGDRCTAGVCTGLGDPCANTACAERSCIEASQSCESTPVDEGQSCGSGLACAAGECVSIDNCVDSCELDCGEEPMTSCGLRCAGADACNTYCADGQSCDVDCEGATQCDAICLGAETDCTTDCRDVTAACTTKCGEAGRCVTRCDNTFECTAQCYGDSSECDVQCPTDNAKEGNCFVECHQGASCDADCTDRHFCGVHCSAASCDIDCSGTQDCDVTCTEGAACNVDCQSSDNCLVTCNGGSDCQVQCPPDNPDCVVALCLWGVCL